MLVLATAVGVLVVALRHRAAFGLVAALLLTACGRQVFLPTPVTSAKSPRVTACAFGVPTTRLDATDVDNGIDVRVTADEKYVRDVRFRAENQARVNGPGWRSGPGHFGEHRLEHDHGLRLWRLATTIPSVHVTAEEIPNGTLIHLTTDDARRVGELRGRLRDRVTFLGTKSCAF